jgi:UTP--glucose-1-phosphate uridylyltransferase
MIHKAVIPAAGFGTRMLPAAKAVPKELLPILDRPVLQYVIEEIACASIGETIVVTSPQKPAIEAHFSHDERLDERLARGNKLKLLQSVYDVISKTKMTYVDQLEQNGLGHAVLCAEQAVGNEPFLCLLGDTIFSGDLLPAVQLVNAYARCRTSVIGLEIVPEEKVERYGIVAGVEVEPGVFRINQLIEKPKRDAAPSRMAIAARYILSPGIFACLRETQRDKNGEIQLTDGLQRLLAKEQMHGVVLSGRRHDVGNPLDWLKTNLIFASRDLALWTALKPLLRELQ